ncbi:hypothetical protein TNCV_5064421 [Trichonephila clavipes]|nr:hypothetical protein TNCV_5064421 [Trichonephila clavipes]
MTEQNLFQHIVNRLKPQVLDYVEVRNPITRAQLLQVVSNVEDKYSARETQGSSNNNEIRDWDARRRSPDDRRNRNGQDAGVIEQQNDRRGNYRSTYENRPEKNHVSQGFENRNCIDRNDRGFESWGSVSVRK